NQEDVYAAPDCLISKRQPQLHVANFSAFPARIGRGQELGRARRPSTWLDSASRYTPAQQQAIAAHAALLRGLVSSQAERKDAAVDLTQAVAEGLRTSRGPRSTDEDPLASEPLEGGPKTSEVPPEDTSSEDFAAVIDISEELGVDERARLLQILSRNKEAFSLDGRLGAVKGSKCTIPLRSDAKEVSLPPFPASPAKREVI
ncbi:hypothetical protein OH76DRAFT_1320905, partial [Lentinus brumalis]